MSRSKNAIADLFAPAPAVPMVSAKHSPTDRPWQGPGTEAHDYHPDLQAMGDCTVCGHTYRAHLVHDADDVSPATGF